MFVPLNHIPLPQPEAAGIVFLSGGQELVSASIDRVFLRYNGVRTGQILVTLFYRLFMTGDLIRLADGPGCFVNPLSTHAAFLKWIAGLSLSRISSNFK